MNKHTKGEWKAVCIYGNWVVVNEGDNVIDINNNEANAKLIAAAPNLLEALEELMSIVNIHSKGTNNNFAWAEMDFAQKAINKAKGE